ncbi:hypothetical protein RB195_019162 [Necator americanus]|uniref:BAAT/Acyl-CoA thioester hydrolase C-terminal domain-containing protein n=1 Tax=Necator americanus TaxID=51031 RepID=A0ABR1CCX6_NECAM
MTGRSLMRVSCSAAKGTQRLAKVRIVRLVGVHSIVFGSSACCPFLLPKIPCSFEAVDLSGYGFGDVLDDSTYFQFAMYGNLSPYNSAGYIAHTDAMGLFMSIEPCDDFPCGGYLSCTPPVPFIYNLILLDSCDCEITRIAIKKHWMHPALERTEIEADGFCGTLFKPPGEGPFPAVIDISGTGGGLHEHKGSMLASEGFVVLCVAFFQYKNLVKKLSDVEIEYFEKPIKWLKRQTFTNDRLGLQGVSFGGTIAYRLASRYSQINAVVSINGPHVQNSFINIKEYGELLPQPRSLVWASTSLNDQSSVW